MAKFELQVPVTFGTLVLQFDSAVDLEEKLKVLDLDAVNRVLRAQLKSLAKQEHRKVKPTLEGICDFRPDGTLELFKPAASKTDAMGLVLYAYDPDPVDLQTIGALTSEKNPSAYLGHKSYAKYFTKVGPGLYRLSQEGRGWVSSQVLPKLKQ